MSPDGRVLEQNLEALLRRAYVPVLPRPEFRRAALALARDEVHGRRAAGPRRLSPIAPAAVAAAAAAFLALWIGLRSGAGDQPAPSPTPAGIVASGEAALRFRGQGDWRAATAEELSAGLALAAEGPAVEVETPSARGLVSRAEDAVAALAPASRARFAPLPDSAFGSAGPGRGAELLSGELALALGPRAATWWLSTEAGLVRLAPESALDTRRAGGRTSVHLVRGAAVLERSDGSQLRIEAGEQVDLAGDLLEPAGAGPGRQPAALMEPEPAGADGAIAPPPETAPPAVAALHGRVRDAAGAPVKNFRVLLLREAEVPDVSEPLLKVFESADGTFAWDGVPPERYEVFVEAEGFAQHRSGVLELAGGETLEHDVSLGAGRMLRGWVLDLETEAPLPGAKVFSESEAPSQILPYDLTEPPEYLQRVATAGSDGGFILSDLGPGAHRLRVSAPGHAPEWIAVEVPAGGAVPDVFARLGLGGGIAGLVVDAGGRPLPGSIVLATITGLRAFSYQQTMTDTEGRYAFEHLAPGVHMLIRWDSVEAFNRGADLDDLRPAMVAQGKVATVDFRADLAFLRITGRFLDAAGEPIPLQKFTLLQEEANSLDSVLEWQAEIADQAGAYEIEVPEPGTYLVFATYGMGERLSLVDAIVLEEGVSELVRDVRVPRTRVLCTVLRADDHRPVANALVFALKADPGGEHGFAGKTVADASGVAILDGLPPGRYLFAAASANAIDLGQAATPPFDLSTGEQPHALELLLPEGGALRVRVVDHAGRPVDGAHLTLRTPGGQGVDLLVEPITDFDGRISLYGLAPGAYAVTVTREGFAPAAASAEVRALFGGDLLIQLEPLD